MTADAKAPGPIAVRPEDVLPDDRDSRDFDGVAVRKGTIAAFLQNAAAWLSDTTPSADRAVIERELETAAPALHALGVFAIFEARDECLRTLIERALQLDIAKSPIGVRSGS